MAIPFVCDFWPISRFISEMIQNRAIVTVANFVCVLSSGATFNDLERPLTEMTYNVSSGTLSPTIPYQYSNKDFKVTPLFHAEYLRNGTSYIHTYNKIIIGTYALLKVSFRMAWVILSDLAEYSMTRSIARSLRDSWASCWRHQSRGLVNAQLNGCSPLWEMQTR